MVVERYSGIEALLRLTLVSGLSPRATSRALDELGSAEAVLKCSPMNLAAAAGIRSSLAQEIVSCWRGAEHVERLKREWQLIEQLGVRLVSRDSEEYPKLLAFIDDPPPLLFVRGRLQPEDGLSLAIVGSRRCSQYGREQADRFAAAASEAGLVVVSGGALGIDTAAHRAAVRMRGRTLAVIGSGLAEAYPPENHELFGQIAADDGRLGAVLSELPMSSPPRPENFPARNRIISGLSLGVLVVEATLRSGALITARLANDSHHREVMAVPGRVDSIQSSGCHAIIKEGWAKLVTHFGDVAHALNEAGAMLDATVEGIEARRDGDGARSAQPNLFDQTLTPEQRKVVEVLERPMTLDELAMRTGQVVPRLQGDLTMLQLRGLVKLQAGQYSKRGSSER